MPIKWITDREYIVVGQGEESKNMSASEHTISRGWSPRYADLLELDREWTNYDMDTTLEMVTTQMELLTRIVEDYQAHLANQKPPSGTPTTRSETF